MRHSDRRGPVSVRIPKTRSCTGKPAAFRPALIPPHVRKAASVEAFVPWLQLKGMSSGEMSETLQTLRTRGARVLGLVRVAPGGAVERGNGAIAPRGPVRSPLGVHPGGRDLLRAKNVKLCALVAVGDGPPGVLGGAGPGLPEHPPPAPERLRKAWQGGGRCTIQRRNRVEKI